MVARRVAATGVAGVGGRKRHTVSLVDEIPLQVCLGHLMIRRVQITRMAEKQLRELSGSFLTLARDRTTARLQSRASEARVYLVS